LGERLIGERLIGRNARPARGFSWFDEGAPPMPDPDQFELNTAPSALQPDDEFDAGGEAELEQIVLVDNDLDEPRSFGRTNVDLIATDDLSAADMEAEDHAEQALDHRLEQTFPASDPVSINPGSD
jgi:hypothetical protein